MKILKENKTLAILTLIELICGILVLIDVIAFTKTILRIIGILVTIRGALFAMDYFKKSPETASLGNDLFMSLITIGIGIFFILNPDKIIDTFSLLTSLYGIGLFISAASKIQLAVNELRLKNKKWWYFAILAGLTLIVAYVSFMNPFTTVSSNWTFTGIAMIVLALADVATVVFKYVDIKPKPKVAPETPAVEPIDAQITVKEVIEEPEEIKEVSVEDIIADEKAVMEEKPVVEEPVIEEIKDEDTKVE